MMKTLCVFAFVVLSLTSVSQAAPLACDQLLKQVDKSPDLSGSWYLIAISSDNCLVPAYFSAVMWPSMALDFTTQATPNLYEVSLKVKLHGYCSTDPQPIFFENNAIFYVDSNNAPKGNPNVLLQSGCPDCLVFKLDEIFDFFLLLSRRKNITAAELKEFETQAECLGWYKPHTLNTDHDYENCLPFEDHSRISPATAEKIFQRLLSSYTVPLNCISEKFLYYPRVGFEWVQQKWKSIW